MSVALEGREQVALAAGAVDDREVTAGQLEQIARDLFSLFVGVWLDRWRRKPVLVWGDAGRVVEAAFQQPGANYVARRKE